MDCVLTLIAPRTGDLALDGQSLAEVRRALRENGASISPTVWLSPERACDIAFEGMMPDIADAVTRKVLGATPVDIFCQPMARRKKRLLVADMDSTIVTAETLDELAAFAGIKDKIAAITARAMRGELKFEDALNERVGMLAGLPEAALEQTWASIEFTPGAKTLVKTMRANGAHCMLVSGGFTFFTERVADACGFNEMRANQFEIEDGALTGRVIPPILGRDAKVRSLTEAAAKLGIKLLRAAAVGDGANDIDMLCAAGLGVAFHAKPAVREAAPYHVDHGDLTALLFAQGYRENEFVL